jgi:8-amino-7-oxononanoate synthase
MPGSLADSPLFTKQLKSRLAQIEDQGLRRSIVTVQPEEHGRIRVHGNSCLNLAGNDYLGLGADTNLLQEFYRKADDISLPRYAPGSGASRLMTGSHPGYRELEQGLAALYGTPRALVFNSGYHLNIGLLPALAGKNDLILADKLCHASLIDGMRLSRAKLLRYPHLEYDRIEALLKKHRRAHATVFLVTESIFSMDGDLADLPLLARFRDEYDLVLYVDEAHAVGVRGAKGLGLAEEQGVMDKVDLLVGTFGKAWAGQGAFVACSALVHDMLVNTARSLIFTTGLPPVNILWLNFLLPRITAMTRERQQLRRLADNLRTALRDRGLDCPGSSQIVPVMIGEAERTVRVAERLRHQGFWVHGVRPPTVPPGTSRLRLSLGAAMDEAMLAPLPDLVLEALRQP